MKWRARSVKEMASGDVAELGEIMRRNEAATSIPLPDLIRMVSMGFGVRLDVAKSLTLSQLSSRIGELAAKWGGK